MSRGRGLRRYCVDPDDHGPAAVIALGDGSTPTAVVRVTGSCNLDLVDRLAHIVLEARRDGVRVAPVELSAELREVLALMGLDELLGE